MIDAWPASDPPSPAKGLLRTGEDFRSHGHMDAAQDTAPC